MRTLKISLHLLHHTRTGPVHMYVNGTEDGRWRARFLSRYQDENWEFDSIYQAERWLRFYFMELYPKHRCDGRCVPGPAFVAKDSGRRLPANAGSQKSLRESGGSAFYPRSSVGFISGSGLLS